MKNSLCQPRATRYIPDRLEDDSPNLPKTPWDGLGTATAYWSKPKSTGIIDRLRNFEVNELCISEGG